MRIGLYFGSFNPLHVGHIQVARYFQNLQVFDAIWFVPSPLNPHKSEETLVPAELRLSWVKKALEAEAGMACCDIEFSLGLPSTPTVQSWLCKPNTPITHSISSWVPTTYWISTNGTTRKNWPIFVRCLFTHVLDITSPKNPCHLALLGTMHRCCIFQPPRYETNSPIMKPLIPWFPQASWLRSRLFSALFRGTRPINTPQ